MTETVRAETVERRERVRQFSIIHMEQTSTFPTARAIQTKFLENQYPGNLGSIASDLKEVAKDISLVYQSKQSVDIDGDSIEIPKEALEYTIRAYQLIELQQMKKFDKLKQVALVEVDKTKQELIDTSSKLISVETELEAKVSILSIRDKQVQETSDKLAIQEVELKQAQEKANILDMREEQLQELKEKLATQEKDLKEAQTKARETEIKNSELTAKLTATKKFLDNQHDLHENEIKRVDSKLISLQDKHQTLLSEHQRLETDKQVVDSKLSFTTEERDNFSDDNAKLKNKEINLVNEISGLSASNDGLLDERNLQKQQIVDLRDVIEGLKDKVQTFDSHLQKISGGN